MRPFYSLFVQVFNSNIGQDLILEFTKEMFTMKQFEQVSLYRKNVLLLRSAAVSICCSLSVSSLCQLFLPSLLRFTTGLMSCGDPLSLLSGLEVLVSLILAKAPPSTDGSMAFETYPLLFTGQTTG